MELKGAESPSGLISEPSGLVILGVAVLLDSYGLHEVIASTTITYGNIAAERARANSLATEWNSVTEWRTANWQTDN